MQGVKKLEANRTIVGYPLPNEVDIERRSASQGVRGGTTYPKPVAASGPDFGVGDPYYPTWHPSVLDDGYVEIIAADYGFTGSKRHDAWQGEISDPTEAGLTVPQTNKVRSIRWDPEGLPGFDPRLPAWNNLPPGSYYRGQIPSAKSHAQFTAAAMKQNPAGPLQFISPGVASLVESGLAGS